MQRAAKERLRTIREWRKHMREIHGWPKKPLTCACDVQPGRFRKGQRAIGCGNVGCYLCHGEKYLGIPKHKHKLHDIKECEGFKELE